MTGRQDLPTLDLNNEASLHYTLAGQTIDYIATNGTILLIRTTTGKELHVGWVDDHGVPIKGKPAVRFSGVNILCGQTIVDPRANGRV